MAYRAICVQRPARRRDDGHRDGDPRPDRHRGRLSRLLDQGLREEPTRGQLRRLLRRGAEEHGRLQADDHLGLGDTAQAQGRLQFIDRVIKRLFVLI